MGVEPKAFAFTMGRAMRGTNLEILRFAAAGSQTNSNKLKRLLIPVPFFVLDIHTILLSFLPPLIRDQITLRTMGPGHHRGGQVVI